MKSVTGKFLRVRKSWTAQSGTECVEFSVLDEKGALHEAIAFNREAGIVARAKEGDKISMAYRTAKKKNKEGEWMESNTCSDVVNLSTMNQTTGTTSRASLIDYGLRSNLVPIFRDKTCRFQKKEDSFHTGKSWVDKMDYILDHIDPEEVRVAFEQVTGGRDLTSLTPEMIQKIKEVKDNLVLRADFYGK